MCLPMLAPVGVALGAGTATAATVGTMAVASLAGTGISAYAAYASGKSQKEAAKYNADVADAQAHDALQRGADDAADVKERARRVGSSQVEAFSRSGVLATTGTPLELLTETAGMGERDALKTMNNAKREAWGYKSQAELDRYQGKAAGRGGILNAGGTFLTGATSTYYGAQRLTR